MKNSLAIMFWAIGLSALAVFAVYHKGEPSTKITVTANKKLPSEAKPLPPPKDSIVFVQQKPSSGALASLIAPGYEITIYGAFAFVPEDSTSGLLKTDSGHQFVVLDMAVQNKSGKKAVDIGQILLSATITDAQGNIYPRNALAVEAFEMQYPEQRHKAEYKALKGKIGPGAYYRTTAYGFEAPDKVKDFTISLSAENALRKSSKAQSASFSIE